MTVLLSPIARALGQLDDSVFLGVLLRSLLWSAACFVALHVAAIWAVHRLLDLHGWIGWVADLLGGIGASLVALWLFLPVAAIIGTLYIDRIAHAVERRYYPTLPAARGAPIASQIWDAIGIAARILLLNVLALIAALFLPGAGLVLVWLIGGYTIGRGLFDAVAMRRMPRPAARMVYARVRLAILTQGCILALAGYVPILNLLIPVIGTAAMVHVLDQAMMTMAGDRDAARGL
ncbi:MAG TPA: EI24 domain-containing protein [Acetobacteraceae bacterium]|nr:EI24 domain-containing protein [Acetobacteraceae bacterium]